MASVNVSGIFWDHCFLVDYTSLLYTIKSSWSTNIISDPISADGGQNEYLLFTAHWITSWEDNDVYSTTNWYLQTLNVAKRFC